MILFESGLVLPALSSKQMISGEHGTADRGSLELGKDVRLSGKTELRLETLVPFTVGFFTGSSTNTENCWAWTPNVFAVFLPAKAFSSWAVISGTWRENVDLFENALNSNSNEESIIARYWLINGFEKLTSTKIQILDKADLPSVLLLLRAVLWHSG